MQWTYDFFKYTLADESCLRKTATPLALLPAVARCQGPACLGDYMALKPVRGAQNAGG